MKISISALSVLPFLLAGCKDTSITTQNASLLPNPDGIVESPRTLTDEFKSYWYSGEAELTSYTLEQARYGNLNEGHAVLVFVTEPFLAEKQVKADRPTDQSTSVLKLNSIKKFFTGIYPYSIMTSTFQPVKQKGHALKVSSSVQEWCGHVYSQLNNWENFEIKAHSYFESEGDREFEMEKNFLEDELWTHIRLAPDELPTGEQSVIPSFEYFRLQHKDIKVHTAQITRGNQGENSTYTVHYPELQRTLKITYTKAFPHYIQGWEETAHGGFGSGENLLTTKATLKKRIKAPYWSWHDPDDVALRKELGL